MKKETVPTIIAVLFALGIFGALALSGAPGDVDFAIDEQGPEVPLDWSTTNLDGETVTLADYEGSYVLVNLWATWCGPCRAEMPSLVELEERLGPKGLQFLYLSADQSEDLVAEYLTDKGWDLNVAIVNAVPEQLHSKGIPATFLISPDGRVVLEHIGATNWASDEAIQFFESLLETA